MARRLWVASERENLPVHGPAPTKSRLKLKNQARADVSGERRLAGLHGQVEERV